MRLLILVLVLLGLVACVQPSQSEEQLTVNRSILEDHLDKPTVPTPEKVPFTAKISVLNQIKSNEEFVSEATLKSLMSWENKVLDWIYLILHSFSYYKTVRLIKITFRLITKKETAASLDGKIKF